MVSLRCVSDLQRTSPTNKKWNSKLFSEITNNQHGPISRIYFIMSLKYFDWRFPFCYFLVQSLDIIHVNIILYIFFLSPVLPKTKRQFSG